MSDRHINAKLSTSILQLLGYHLVEYASSFNRIRTVGKTDVEAILPVAFSAYEWRSLRPLVEAMPSAECSYARAAAQVADDGGLSETGDIVRLLGKTHQQVASACKALIDQGVIVAEGRGRIRFCIPRLRSYLIKEPPGSPATRYLDEWGI